MKPLPAFLVGLAAATAACASAATFAVVLQRRAAARSHEQPAYAPPPEFAAIPPARRLAEGRRLFLNSCAHCHGEDGRGDDGPDLHALWVSDRRIATVIHGGIKGEMPSFAKKHRDVEIAELIAYLRTLD